uniref:Uncharacterized protein n=1 Tax=Quercus lobata TaxID=97700 RepID=A0A7N2R7B2_QUELO
MGNSNFDGKGSYLVFNVGDAIFISDMNSQDKGIVGLETEYGTLHIKINAGEGNQNVDEDTKDDFEEEDDLDGSQKENTDSDDD